MSMLKCVTAVLLLLGVFTLVQASEDPVDGIRNETSWNDDLMHHVSKALCNEHSKVLANGVSEDQCPVNETLLWDNISNVVGTDVGNTEEACALMDLPFAVDAPLACHLLSRYARACDCSIAACEVNAVQKNFKMLGHPQCTPLLWNYCDGAGSAFRENCEAIEDEVFSKLGIYPNKTALACDIRCAASVSGALHCNPRGVMAQIAVLVVVGLVATS